MRITGTQDYLQLALHTLGEKLEPELTSADGRAAAAMLRQALEELLKREQASAPLLKRFVENGRALDAQMSALCTRAGLPVCDSAADVPCAISDDTSFAALAAQHDALTQVIARRAGQLASLRSVPGTAAQGEVISSLLLEAARWEQGFAAAQRDMAVDPPPALPALRGGALTRELLENFLRSQHPAGNRLQVDDLLPISGGFGKQTFRATVRNAAGAIETLIVRKSDPAPMVDYGCFRIDTEYQLLHDLVRSSDLPLAQPLYLGMDVPGVDADFYVMSALPGAVPSSFLGAATASIPQTILLEMAAAMARLHQVALDRLPAFLSHSGSAGLATGTIEACYRGAIQGWKDYFQQNDHLPSPFVTYLIDWLEQNVPPDTAHPVLVHGDFNIHNVLAVDDRITGILDWECAMIGAPEQDLAYVKPIVSQHIAWDHFLAHYAASGGRPIDEARLDFYMAFAAMRLCVIFNKGVRNMQDGITRDIRYAVVDLGLTPEFMKQALICTGAFGSQS